MSQRVPKGSQKDTKTNQKGAKRQPKGSKRVTEMHKQIDLWNKSRKRCQKGSIPHLEMGAFLGLTSIKNAVKNQWMSKIASDGTNMWPNGRPNDAKVNPNATKGRCSEKVAKKSTEKAHTPTFFQSHFRHMFDQKCVQKVMQTFISKNIDFYEKMLPKLC